MCVCVCVCMYVCGHDRRNNLLCKSLNVPRKVSSCMYMYVCVRVLIVYVRVFAAKGVAVTDEGLKFDTVGKEDEDSYRCTARSSAGPQHSSWVYLKVLGEYSSNTSYTC